MSGEQTLREDALGIFGAALEASHAGNAVRRHLHRDGKWLVAGSARFNLDEMDQVVLVAVGKAALEMGTSIQSVAGEWIQEAIIVTKPGHANEAQQGMEVIEAGHPIPDETSVLAAERVLSSVRRLGERDLLLLAISGGASSLLSSPVTPCTLLDKQKTTDALLRAGAAIDELNCVRKHLSGLKGGRLAELAYPARVVVLVLSDVVGDRLEVIGSGPAAPDSSTYGNALAVLEKFELLEQVPRAVRALLLAGADGDIAETPKPGSPMFARTHSVIVGSNRRALDAAATKAKQLGYPPLILSSTLQGEARQVAGVHAQILHEAVRHGDPIAAPACILSGGETTVTVSGSGKGGRNQEFALAAAIGISGLSNVCILSAGTDGNDGPTDAAGAIADGATVQRGKLLGMEATDYLQRNDSYVFFETLNDLVKTGPTGTNVMDINIMLARRS